MTLEGWKFLVEVLTLLVLIVYAWHTMKIKEASVAQSEAANQPFLVLVARLREGNEQIWESLSEEAQVTTFDLPPKVRNISGVPAYDVEILFRNRETLKLLWKARLPYLVAGDAYPVPVMLWDSQKGAVTFEVRFRSISGVAFYAQQEITDGVLGKLKVRVVRRLFPERLEEDA